MPHKKHFIELEAQTSLWLVWASDTLKGTGQERTTVLRMVIDQISKGKLDCFSTVEVKKIRFGVQDIL